MPTAKKMKSIPASSTNPAISSSNTSPTMAATGARNQCRNVSQWPFTISSVVSGVHRSNSRAPVRRASAKKRLAWIPTSIRAGAGPDMDLLLDLNFNAKTEGYLKILRAIKDMDMFWVEIDSFNPQALGYIRRQSPHPVSSCETLLGLREFLPYFTEQAIRAV